MSSENSAGEEQAGARDAKRSRVLLTAKLQTPRGELDARLRDLSCKGALLECQHRLAIGDEVVFHRGATVVPARVAWAAGNRIGIEFLQPIAESEVLIHVGARASAQAPQPAHSASRFRRPRFGEDLSEYDRKLARVLGASLGVSLIDE